MRWAKAVDENQSALVAQLRKLGVWVWVTSSAGNGFPDLLCCHKNRFVLLEIKDPGKPPSRQALTPAEQAFLAGCPGPTYVVRTLDEAVRVLGLTVSQ